MIVYILALAISILLIAILEKKVRTNKIEVILKILAVLPFFIISAIRYDVGTDYLKRYTYDYSSLANGISVDNLEIGFKTLIYICLKFTQSPYLLFVITSLIIVTMFFIVFYKNSKNIILSITIFFLGGYFFASLNLIRQYMAIAFILVGYRFLLSDNNKKAYIGFGICAIISFLMHSTSIVCFIIMFLNRKMLVSIKWVLPASVIIILINENFMAIISPIVEKTRFNVYLTGNMARGEVSIITIIKNLIIYIWMYIIYLIHKKEKQTKQEEILFLNIQGVAFLTTILGTVHMQFLRIAMFFEVFHILSIPYYLSIMPYDYIANKIDKKFKQNLKEKTIKIISYISVLICFVSLFSYTNILNNDNEVIPYKTVFSNKNK